MKLSFIQLLTLTFVLLRAFGVIHWSWVLVFVPLWGTLLIAGVLGLAALLLES